ncbi:MAG: S8 family serine peptidase [Ferruginibacter sp.]
MATKKNPGRIIIIVLLLVLLIIFLIFRYSPSRRDSNTAQTHLDTSKFILNNGWNVLFKNGTTQAKKNKLIANIEDSIRQFYIDYNNIHGTYFSPEFGDVAWCPCDSTLYNFNFKCVNGAGDAVSSPPPRKPGPAGSGDLIDVLFISNNLVIAPPKEPSYPGIDSVNSVMVGALPLDNAKILAVIDSGIDTTLFQPDIQRLIWTEAGGASTLYNFLPGQPLKDLSDPGRSKHGSAVAALAIKAMSNVTKYPRLMILKALDKGERGSIFTVSCAMSYAIQKNATLINASLGYYGEADDILGHYVQLAANHEPSPILLFAAAGNTINDYPHDENNLCNGGFNRNELSKTRLFFPACFPKQLGNITSVTQIKDADSSCFYQNFSNEYVSLGVLNKSNCCAFTVDFRQRQQQYYEGSSFATPVASGKRMATLLNNNTESGASNAWRSLIIAAPKKRVTINGNYIIYAER